MRKLSWLFAFTLCVGCSPSPTATPSSTSSPAPPDYVALIDLGGDTYHGNPGGLYGDGANTPPSGHLTEGLARANALQALDTSGKPSGGGRIVMVSIGMSNTT